MKTFNLHSTHPSTFPSSFRPGAFALRLALAMAAVAVAVAVVLTPVRSDAATIRNWAGGSATSGNWTTAANWSNGVPVPGDILSFHHGGQRKTSTTNNFPAGTAFSSLNFFGGGYRLRGASVTVSNYVTSGNPPGTNQIDLDLTAAGPGVGLTLRSFSAASRITITGDINLNGRTLVTDGPADFVLSGVISGTAGIRKDNTGDLTLSGPFANTYTGPTVVNAGALRLGKALFLIGPPNVIAPRVAVPGDLIIGSGTAGPIGDLVVLNFSHQISDASDVTVFGSGELALDGNDDTIGSLTMTGGHVYSQDGATVGTLTLGGTVQVNVGTTDSVVDGQLNLGSGSARLFNIVQGAELRMNAVVSGGPGISLVKSNRGEMVMTASNLFSGDVELKGGTLAVTHGSALGDTDGVTRLISGSLAADNPLSFGTLEPLEVAGPAATLHARNGGVSWIGSIVFNDDLGINIATNKSVTLLGLISGPAGFFKYGPGTLTLKTTYTNTYAGTSEVRDGTLILDGVFNQPVIPSGPLVIGTDVPPSGNANVSLIKQHQIGDSVPVTINRSGRLALNFAQDTIGPITFNGGGLIEVTTGLLVLNGDILANAGADPAQISGALSLGGITRTFYTLGSSNSPDLAISAVISDGPAPAGFNKVGEGELELLTDNTFTGPVSVTDGTLRLGQPNALGTVAAGTTVSGIDGARILLDAPGNVILNEPLTLNSTAPGAFPALVNFIGNNQWNGPITLLAPENTVAVLSPPRPLALGGAISGPGGLRKTGPGNLTLNGATTNTFNGLTFVAEGELILDKPASESLHGDLTIGDGVGGPNADRVRVRGGGDEIWNGSRVVINSSGQLILDSVLDLVGSIEGPGNILLQNATSGLIVGRNDLSTAFDGVISGAGGFEKVGQGTLTLNGNHGYTGASGATEGTLVVNGSIASSLHVQLNRPLVVVANTPPGVLAGQGTVPTIIPFPGGLVSPGTSPGRLTVQGHADLSRSGLRIEINGTTPASQFDQLRATGNVTLSDTRLFFTVGFVASTNDTFLILDKTSPGPINGYFLNTTEGSIMGTGLNKFRITYQGGDGNDVVLRRVEIPGSIITHIAPVTSERMQIRGQGVPFATYILEATPLLTTPAGAIPWTPIATNSANSTGIYEFIDAYFDAADGGTHLFPARFYRVQSP